MQRQVEQIVEVPVPQEAEGFVAAPVEPASSLAGPSTDRLREWIEQLWGNLRETFAPPRGLGVPAGFPKLLNPFPQHGERIRADDP